MFLVIMAMIVTVDVRRRGVRGRQRRPAGCPASSKDRKATYAAAEAGLAYYLNHLQQDPDYWTKCDKVARSERDREEPGQPAVGRRRRGHAHVAHDPRRDRRSTRSSSLDTKTRSHRRLRHDRPAVDHRRVHRHVQDPLHRPPLSGRPAASQHRRHVPARQLPQLRLLHRLREPATRTSIVGLDGARADAERVRRQVPHRARHRRNGCPSRSQISLPRRRQGQRPAAHQRREPLRLRHADVRAREERSTAPRSTRQDRHGRGARAARPGPRARNPTPTALRGQRRRSTRRRPTSSRPTPRRSRMPQSNQKLATSPPSAASCYAGKTIIRLNGTTMDVTNYATGSATTTTGVAWPNNGVLYVDNGLTALHGRVPDGRPTTTRRASAATSTSAAPTRSR